MKNSGEWRKIIMPVARNMKELEKMVLDRMKKELPNATKEYAISGITTILI